jgi:hypothetical protein
VDDSNRGRLQQRGDIQVRKILANISRQGKQQRQRKIHLSTALVVWQSGRDRQWLRRVHWRGRKEF